MSSDQDVKKLAPTFHRHYHTSIACANFNEEPVGDALLFRTTSRRTACVEASLGGRPWGRGLGFRDLRIGTAYSQRFG